MLSFPFGLKFVDGRSSGRLFPHFYFLVLVLLVMKGIPKVNQNDPLTQSLQKVIKRVSSRIISTFGKTWD